MNYYKNDIKHIKGDTFPCGLVVEDLGQDLDEINFTCRDSLNDNSEVLFQCTLGNGISLVEYDAVKDIRKYAIRVSPEKTENLQSGTYYYDEEVRVNNDIFTIMKGRFVIEQDASRGGITPVDPELYIKVILDEINGEVIGTSVIDKTDYLSDTKDLIKDSLNNLGADLTNSSTFRSYASSIDDLYDEWPKVSDEDTAITLNNTKKGKINVDLKGNTSQYTTTGKNLLPLNTLTEVTDNGITFTPVFEGNNLLYVRAKGTASANATYRIYGVNTTTVQKTFSNATKISFGLTGSNSTYGMVVWGLNSGGTDIGAVIYNETEYASGLQLAGIGLRVISGANVDIQFKPMIRLSSITDDTYEPYTNGVSPNPDYPQDVNVVSGNNIITIGDGTDSEDYQINLGTLELCKIGNYQDYIYKENDKWYKYSAIKVITLDSSKNWTYNSVTQGSLFRSNNTITDEVKDKTYAPYSNYYTGIIENNYTNRQNNQFYLQSANNYLDIIDNRYTSADDFKTWLSNNNVKIYYPLENSTTTEITDTTLINQLEALKNAESYEETTNISQVNNDEAFIISASALMKGGN